MSRRIVQIAAVSDRAAGDQTAWLAGSMVAPPILYALCDDGTVWSLNVAGDGKQSWCRVVAIPQMARAAHAVVKPDNRNRLLRERDRLRDAVVKLRRQVQRQAPTA